MAERGGFEPPRDGTAPNGFRDRRMMLATGHFPLLIADFLTVA